MALDLDVVTCLNLLRSLNTVTAVGTVFKEGQVEREANIKSTNPLTIINLNIEHSRGILLCFGVLEIIDCE
jgi:hypothetical protein